MVSGSRLRIIFFGTPEFGVPTLRALIDSRHSVIGVVSQPDRRRGRGQTLAPPPTKILAHDHGIEVLQPERLRDETFLTRMRFLAPDLAVVAAYGKLRTNSSVTFVSQAALDAGLAQRLGVAKKLAAVRNVRGGISKASMIHNSLTPHIEVNPETYEVRADGELLVCEPAKVLPMAQRYFLF